MVRIETKKNANKGREKLMDKFQKAFWCGFRIISLWSVLQAHYIQCPAHSTPFKPIQIQCYHIPRFRETEHNYCSIKFPPIFHSNMILAKRTNSHGINKIKWRTLQNPFLF
jgi:hypothetical protein